MILIGFIVIFSLYMLGKGVECRESNKKLQDEINRLRESNQNLANIIQEDIDKKDSFEMDCG
tara:strand:+ start:369 stop:554 length:186 start_codon:yes stop_codon:yes gene_type:complete